MKTAMKKTMIYHKGLGDVISIFFLVGVAIFVIVLFLLDPLIGPYDVRIVVENENYREILTDTADKIRQDIKKGRSVDKRNELWEKFVFVKYICERFISDKSKLDKSLLEKSSLSSCEKSAL